LAHGEERGERHQRHDDADRHDNVINEFGFDHASP